jgi:cytochrome b6-f complex iron-sulfur subunit
MRRSAPPAPAGSPLCPRRPVLLGGLAAAATTALAGCGGGDQTATSDSSPSVASSSGTSGSASASGGSGDSGGSGGASLVAVSDVPVGGSVSAKTADGKPILVSQPKKGDVVAFSAICTHKGCTVNPAGKQFKCPCHGSVYDAATGKNVGGPAPSPLAPVTVHVEKGKVVEG